MDYISLIDNDNDNDDKAKIIDENNCNNILITMS